MISARVHELEAVSVPETLSVHASALDSMSFASNYHDWILQTVHPFIGQRILEVGGGFGSFSQALEDRERLIVIDNDPACCRRLQRRFANRQNMRIVEADILDNVVADNLAGERLDTIVCVNVLEHIVPDVSALHNMHKMLIPGGHAVIFVPALPQLFGALDRELGHVRRYRRSEIQEKMASVGFEIEKCHFFNSIGAVSWFITGRVRHQNVIQAHQVRLYDRFVVPSLSRLERLSPPPFGQSLIAVARK